TPIFFSSFTVRETERKREREREREKGSAHREKARYREGDKERKQWSWSLACPSQVVPPPRVSTLTSMALPPPTPPPITRREVLPMLSTGAMPKPTSPSPPSSAHPAMTTRTTTKLMTSRPPLYLS